MIVIQLQQNLPVLPEHVSLTTAIAGRAAQRIRHLPGAVQEEAIPLHGRHPVALQVHGLAEEGINLPRSTP